LQYGGKKGGKGMKKKPDGFSWFVLGFNVATLIAILLSG